MLRVNGLALVGARRVGVKTTVDGEGVTAVGSIADSVASGGGGASAAYMCHPCRVLLSIKRPARATRRIGRASAAPADALIATGVTGALITMEI